MFCWFWVAVAGSVAGSSPWLTVMARVMNAIAPVAEVDGAGRTSLNQPQSGCPKSAHVLSSVMRSTRSWP